MFIGVAVLLSAKKLFSSKYSYTIEVAMGIIKNNPYLYAAKNRPGSNRILYYLLQNITACGRGRNGHS